MVQKTTKKYKCLHQLKISMPLCPIVSLHSEVKNTFGEAREFAERPVCPLIAASTSVPGSPFLMRLQILQYNLTAYSCIRIFAGAAAACTWLRGSACKAFAELGDVFLNSITLGKSMILEADKDSLRTQMSRGSPCKAINATHLSLDRADLDTCVCNL